MDLARELKKLWNVKVTVISIVISALNTVTEWLIEGQKDLEIRGQGETIQNTALPRSVKILRRAVETLGDLLSVRPQWKAISLRCSEKLSNE